MNWHKKLKNYLTSRKLLANPGVEVGEGSRVNFRGIHLRPSCTFRIGRASLLEGQIHYERDGAEVTIGSNTFIGASSIISAQRVDIGNDVLIAWGCTIIDHNSHSLDPAFRCKDLNCTFQNLPKDWDVVRIGPVKICDRAWIGFNCIILKGVVIGEGAIVGAGSVVSRDVPPYTVVAGNPARVIRELPRP